MLVSYYWVLSPIEDMDASKDMFRTLPEVFRESALLDRFHGFIKYETSREMNERLKINDWRSIQSISQR
jgi:ATP-dependent Lon protease